MTPPIKVILGAVTIGDSSASPMAKLDTPEKVNRLLDIFYARGYRRIDTARIYAPGAPGTSERRLGTVDAGKRFTIDSKAMIDSEGSGFHSKAKILESVQDSLSALKQPQMNVYYLHLPERITPFEEAHEGLNEAYQTGKIKQFGISNHTPEEVEQFVSLSNTKGFVKPTVYQGQYNPIVRGAEKDLFPVLRKHGIAFYAYSPAGAGFFAGNHKGSSTRFDKSHWVGQWFSSLYDKPELDAAFQGVVATAAKYNISGHAAALRWTAYHSALDPSLGDAIIIGASKVEQLEENLDIIAAGPLPDEVAQAVEDVYRHVGEAEIKPWF